MTIIHRLRKLRDTASSAAKRRLGERGRIPSVPQPRERRYYGLQELDRKLEQYLDFDGGIFVEAGANDGLTQSNTAYFEQFRGWRGMLVEPIPELAKKCRTNRPHSIVESCALVPFSADGTTVSMTYCNLMSVVDGSWPDAEAERAHIALGKEVQALHTSYQVAVRGQSLSALLDRHRLGRVDLLSLDVEGFERQALEGLDLARHKPKYILVEDRFGTHIEDLLKPFYQIIAQISHHDFLYRLREVR